jgi:hypothetical protein
VKSIRAEYSKLDTPGKRQVLQASLDALDTYGFQLNYVSYLEVDLVIQVKEKGELVDKTLEHLPPQRFQELKKNKKMPEKQRSPPHLCDPAMAQLEEWVDMMEKANLGVSLSELRKKGTEMYCMFRGGSRKVWRKVEKLNMFGKTWASNFKKSRNFGYRKAQEVPMKRLNAAEKKCNIVHYFLNLQSGIKEYGILETNL